MPAMMTGVSIPPAGHIQHSRAHMVEVVELLQGPVADDSLRLVAADGLHVLTPPLVTACGCHCRGLSCSMM
jgi:hypothetical protein